MEELKPCPFCGGEASFMTIKKPYGECADGSEAVWLRCENCGACTNVCCSRQAAVEAWNRREGEKKAYDEGWSDAEKIGRGF